MQSTGHIAIARVGTNRLKDLLSVSILANYVHFASSHGPAAQP